MSKSIAIKPVSETLTSSRVGSKGPVFRSASAEEHAREATTTGGQAPDAGIREKMESRFGRSFGDVRIHADERAGIGAQALGATAFTYGSSIAFAKSAYNPSTTSGQYLLAHEFAHVAHNQSAPSRRTGIAPEPAMAEYYAQQAAHAALSGGSAPDVGNWGTPWSIHRQVDKISKKGKLEHSGEVGRKPGEIGVPVGKVEVRTGEEFEFKSGAKIPNVIALAYAGSLSPDTHWLQFVWFELIAMTPKGLQRVSATIPTTSGTKPFTTDPAAPNWSIDTASPSSPFYEAAGLNLRNTSSITIFDAPGGASVKPLAEAVFKAGVGAVNVIFSAHFETFLIQNNSTVYQVSYSASTGFADFPTVGIVGGDIGYTIGTVGQVSALPAHHKTMLDTAFPAFKAIK